MSYAISFKKVPPRSKEIVKYIAAQSTHLSFGVAEDDSLSNGKCVVEIA
jgi:flagellar biosynthesis/type III secretory pathway protein FliH